MKESQSTSQSSGESFSIQDLIKWIGQFIGLVGGGGAGFTALAFGVGYLAIKNHDAMLGLPTTISSYESYVRTGALFFPNSVQYLISGLSAYGWVAFTVTIIAIVIPLLLYKWPPRFDDNIKAMGLLVAYAFVILLAFLSCQRQIAVLHPVNKDLLFKEAHDAEQVSGYARQIHDWLRVEDELEGAVKLQRLYGIQLFQTIALLYAAFLFWGWRRKLDNPDGVPPSLAIADWLFRPVLYGLLGALLLVLPSNFGVLCLSNRPPCIKVTLQNKEEPERMAYLVSNLSTDTTKVVAITIDDTAVHHFYARRDLTKIETLPCGVKNMLKPR